MDLSQLTATPLDARVKGLPGGISPVPLGEIGRRGWNLLREDLPLPVAVLKDSAVRHNSHWMSRFVGVAGVSLAPHGKTTMAPQLFQRQLDDGAWGITLATVSQVQVARHYGVARIFLANQLVGRQGIRYVTAELARDPSFEFLCLVDSRAGVRLLRDGLTDAPPGRPLEVLVEAGFAGGRTGCRTVAAALEVAAAVKAAEPLLTLRGVEGFEGAITGNSPDARAARVRAFLDFLVEIAVRCEEAGAFGTGEVLLSAGGSSFYDLVVQQLGAAQLGRSFRVVTRSGCYLTHDAGMYAEDLARLLERTPVAAELGTRLQPALEVWAYVQSVPERHRAILTAGKRDLSYDYGLPRPVCWCRPGEDASPRPLDNGYAISALNDQHAYLDLPANAPLRVGDMIGLGISHPCTTFDRWQVLLVVDDSYNVVGAVRTFF